jgi:hypothetical protein
MSKDNPTKAERIAAAKELAKKASERRAKNAAWAREDKKEK